MSTPTDSPAQPRDIDVVELVKRSWALFAQKPAEHVITGLIVTLLSAVSFGIVAGPLIVGYVRMIERQRNGESIDISEVFKGFERFVPSLIAVLIVGIAAGLGFMLFVLPGVLVMVVWMFTLWFVALREQTAAQALTSSWRLFVGNPGGVAIAVLSVALVGALGAVTLLASLLTVPLSIILATVMFHELT